MNAKKGDKAKKLKKIWEFVQKYFFQVTVKDIANLCKITTGTASDYLKTAGYQHGFEAIEVDRKRTGVIYAIKHYCTKQMSIFDLMEAV